MSAPPARLWSAPAWALTLAAVLLAYSLGQSTDARSSWTAALSKRPVVLTPQGTQAAYQPQPQPPTYAAPPPPQQPRTILGKPPRHLRPGRLRALDQFIAPEPLFSCPRAPARLETGGPHNRVQIRRRGRLLCVLARSAALPARSDVSGLYPVLTVRFRHKGRPEHYDVQLGAEDGQPTYMLVSGWSSNSKNSVRRGNVGIARGHISVLLNDVLMPGWVLDPDESTWTAQFH